MECERGNIASRIEPGGIDGRDLGDADHSGDRVVYCAGERRRKQHRDEGTEYRIGSGRTAADGHEHVVAWRDGGHGVLNNTAGQRWNYALHLECECGHVASGIELGGIDGRDLGDADHSGDRIVHSAGDRRSK